MSSSSGWGQVFIGRFQSIAGEGFLKENVHLSWEQAKEICT